MVKYLLCFLSLTIFIHISSAETRTDSTSNTSFFKKIPYKQIIAPASLMTYGIVALESHSLINQNHELNNEIHEHNPSKFHLDDFSQYSTTAAVYALPAFGVKPIHSLKYRLVNSLIANGIMAITTLSIKETGTVWRPDHTSSNSFPSGHTATAFVGAEQLWQEYKDISPWYGIAGYSVATATGFFRMYNNRHWFSDVAMGAGIGIMSTKIAYWISPLLINEQGKSSNISFVPIYDNKNISVLATINF